jgi:hypothetical protein
LRVQCETTGIVTIDGQIGVCYNPKDLQKWKAAAGTPKHKDPTARINLIRKFLENRDNIFEVSPKRHIFMVGVWSLIEHCCSGPSLNFARERKMLDKSPKQGACIVELVSGCCELESKRGYCVWHYGQEFVQQTECACFVCK